MLAFCFFLCSPYFLKICASQFSASYELPASSLIASSMSFLELCLRLRECFLLLMRGSLKELRPQESSFSFLRELCFFLSTQSFKSYIFLLFSCSSMYRRVFLASFQIAFAGYSYSAFLVLYLISLLFCSAEMSWTDGVMPTSSIQRSSSQGQNGSLAGFVFDWIFCIKLLLLIGCKQPISQIVAIEIAQHVNVMSCCLISSCWRCKHQKDNSNIFINIIMILKRILAFGLLLPIFLGIRLKLSVDRNEGPVCFYENLQKDEKYLFKVEADSPNFRMDVMTQDSQNTGWKEVTTKMAKRISQSINKMTEQVANYAFCISSTEERTLRATVEIQTKLQLANFDYLPNLDDNENLNREIDWMVRQKEKMFEIINRMEGIRSSSEQVKSMMGVTMIVLAILGLVVVAAVNFMFYTLAKKTLKDRKLI